MVTASAAPVAAPARRPSLPRPGEALALAVLALLLVAALAPGLLTTHDPYGIQPAEAFQGPSGAHWFGTDENGRDLFSRVIQGTRSSFLIGVFATALGLGVAVVLGTAAGLGNRAVDFVVSRILEVGFAIPGIMLALLLAAVLGGGVVASGLAVGLATAPGYARVIRSQVRAVRGAGYVEAATVLGRGRWTLLRRHIMPNTLAPLYVLGTLGIGQAVVWATSLSFLGIGVVPPNPEWGALLSAGRPYIQNAWWLTVFPGVFIVLGAACVTVLGRSLQRRTRER
ncbi:ABC transporter permease [Yinghuangia sp. ASG 101]|uniref:ABC transporter permease n=1 Tax=Yinghuangia sp. ASG 101 TaxID=2896848 RepID=UPI001E40E959|nr:ABC transporter permease [Yinghuangia sp. ASG 101]UGQ11970.1 ABC transporter permease [Yinghuangia sp. ASG 101]